MSVPLVLLCIFEFCFLFCNFGASVAPQMPGVVVDAVSASNRAAELSATLSISAEQIDMKCGMLTAAIFPLLGVFLLIYIKNILKVLIKF